MEDAAIVALLFARSEQAIAELNTAYGALCRRIADDVLHDRDDAEECVNDTWLAVWDTVPPADPSPLSSYVCRITRNLALKHLRYSTAVKRDRSRDVAISELEATLASACSAEDAVNAAELTACLNRFLETLDKPTRVLFVRRYWFGDEIADLAKRLGRSPHYISVRLSRTRTRLKTFLQKEGYTL